MFEEVISCYSLSNVSKLSGLNVSFEGARRFSSRIVTHLQNETLVLVLLVFKEFSWRSVGFLFHAAHCKVHQNVRDLVRETK